MDFVDNSATLDLIRRVRAGDDEAFSLLVSQYTPLIKGIIARLSLDTDECFSEACVGLYRAALSFNIDQDGVTFGLYARICITNRLYDLIRSSDGARVSDTDVDSIAVPDGTLSRLMREEERARLHARVRSLLSDYEYRVFLLWLDGYKTAAIADRLGASAKSVDNAKARIIKKLRDGLTPD